MLVSISETGGLELSLEDFERDFSLYSEGIFVAESDGVPVGFLILRRQPPPPGVPGSRPLQISHLQVLPAHLGQGASRSLMGRAFVHAHARNHDVIWLETSSDNARAIAFFAKCGLYRVDAADADPASTLAVLMACSIA